MPDREKVVSVLRRYYNLHMFSGWQETEFVNTCRDAADLLEEDQRRIQVLQNTIDDLGRQLERATVTMTADAVTVEVTRRRRRNRDYR